MQSTFKVSYIERKFCSIA